MHELTDRLHVALATAAELPDLDADGPSLIAALADLDVAARAVVWDDPAVDWASFDLVVIRSTWDYTFRRADYLAWADRVAATTRLANPAEVVRWNTDKLYLRELADAGLPVVPTTWIEPGDDVVAPTAGEFVVKPAVSAGARDTARFAAGDLEGARELVTRLHGENRTVMVQPYLDAVDAEGETALIYCNGVYSHAIRKGPLLHPGGTILTDGSAEEDIRPRVPSPGEQRLADRVLRALPHPPHALLYARVDVALGPEGEPLLLELEITEPSLFLGYGDQAVARFASGIRRWL